MRYTTFEKTMNKSRQDLCREVFNQNRHNISVKKEKTAVKNLEKIFDAVFNLSYKKGFQAMSMRDLSNESGLSMGALYSYVSSKEELLKMLQRQSLSMIGGVLGTFVEREKDPAKKLRALVRTHIFLSEFIRPWFYFLFMEAKNLSDDQARTIRAMDIQTEEMLVDFIKRGVKKGAFVKRNPRLTASMIKAMQQDWYLKRWKYAKRDLTVDKYANFVWEVIEAFLVDPTYQGS